MNRTSAAFQPRVAFQRDCSVLDPEAHSLNPHVVFQPDWMSFSIGNGHRGCGGMPRCLKGVACDFERIQWHLNANGGVNEIVVPKMPLAFAEGQVTVFPMGVLYEKGRSR